MALYPEYKHGALGEVIANGSALTNARGGIQALVYVGTAPAHTVPGGADTVNKPILVNDMAEAKKRFGYSENWADYTLCEAMYAHFTLGGVGPIVLLNVYNPVTASTTADATYNQAAKSGRITIAGVESCAVDKLQVRPNAGSADPLVLGKDYTAAYDTDKGVLEIRELVSGKLSTGSTTNQIKVFNAADIAGVTAQTVIGETDGLGHNTGLQAVRDVYNLTGYIPAYLLAPGFSSVPEVHAAMLEISQNIAGHWNAWVFADLPLTSAGTALTLETAVTYKNDNGYTADNESVYFPMAVGTDGRHYHISVLSAVNFQKLLIQNSGVPYMTSSNTEAAVIQNLYLGEESVSRVYSDDVINAALNANGISSAAYIGGRWVIWGLSAASYSQENQTSVNVFDTCLMMLYYLTNDFQHRRGRDVDRPMPVNDLKTMVAEEQARVDALVGIGALTYGKVELDAERITRSDIMSGDFRILFNVTNTPLAKSLTAIANWTVDGYEIYFAAMTAQQ